MREVNDRMEHYFSYRPWTRRKKMKPAVRVNITEENKRPKAVGKKTLDFVNLNLINSQVGWQKKENVSQPLLYLLRKNQNLNAIVKRKTTRMK